MRWGETGSIEPEVLAGRAILGAAVRRARLRHGLTQAQLGSYVMLDQTTISRLETAKLKGLRFEMVCRVIGLVSRAFELPDAPLRPTRRLPGESLAARPTIDRVSPSYDADGHALDDIDDHGGFGSYEGVPAGPHPGQHATG